MARHMGLRVLAISLVTNNVVMDVGPSGADALTDGKDDVLAEQQNEEGKATHEEVIEAGNAAAQDLKVWLCMSLTESTSFRRLSKKYIKALLETHLRNETHVITR